MSKHKYVSVSIEIGLLLIFLSITLFLGCKTKHYLIVKHERKTIYERSHYGTSIASASIGYDGFHTDNQKHLIPSKPKHKIAIQNMSPLLSYAIKINKGDFPITESEGLINKIDTPPGSHTSKDTISHLQTENTSLTKTQSTYYCGLFDVTLILSLALLSLFLGLIFGYLYWISNTLVLKIIFGFLSVSYLLYSIPVLLVAVLQSLNLL